MTSIPALLVSMSGGSDHDARGVRIAPRRGSRDAVARAVAAARGRRRRARRPGADSRPAEVLVPLRRRDARRRRLRESPRVGRGRAAPAEAAAAPPETIGAVVTVDPLGIEVGYALVTIVDEKQGGTLLGRAAGDPQADRVGDRHGRAAGARRRQPAARPAHLRDSRQGRRSRARRAVHRSPAGDQSRHRDARRSRASPTREPAFGLPAIWIAPGSRDSAIGAGYTVVDPTTAISTHLSEVIRSFLPDLLTRQQTKELDRSRRADVAEARRGARAEGGVASATCSACCASCCASACRCAT